MPQTTTITVLFSDLVGSTYLSSRLGPQASEELRQVHFGLLRAVVSANGGIEVKNLGDGLMVAFTSLSRGLACAVGMQQAIERHNRKSQGEALAIRIGMATGEAVEEEGDYFGEPVVEAARLCAAAQGGQILTTEVTRALVGRHATQAFSSVGDLTLKGLPDPVPSVEIHWEPDHDVANDAIRPPLPARLVGASSESVFAFFGRRAELAFMEDTHKASTANKTLRVVLVSGEPGIGKTSLVAQAARSAHGAGATVVYGACQEGVAAPYGPWSAVLSALVEHTAPDVLSDFVDANGAVLARLVPSLGKLLSLPVPASGSDAATDQFLVLEATARLLARISTLTPLLVVLDDLHWADAASLQVLRHLVAAALPMGVTVIGTFRSSDVSRTHPLSATLADLRREPAVARIELRGLEDTEIIDLMEAAAGHVLPTQGVALAHALRHETDGNPFFVVEVLRHLGETDRFAVDAHGRWSLTVDVEELSLPSSVREVVAQRVARLGDDTAQALSLAAVIGRDFDIELLAAVAKVAEDTLIDHMERAIAAGILSESDTAGRYRFVHALIGHTLYQDMSATRRQRAHRRVAETLEIMAAGDDQVTELAGHWLAATRPAEASKAIFYAQRAGDLALAASAPADAVSWYAKALELLERQPDPDAREHAALLVALGTAEHRTGLSQHRVHLFDAARRAEALGDAELLAGAALGLSRGNVGSAVTDVQWTGVLDSALRATGDNPATRALLLVTLAEATDPREWERRLELATEALATARRSNNVATKADVMIRSYAPRYRLGEVLERLDETAEAIALADEVGDPALSFRARNNRVHACMEAADIIEVDRRIEEMGALAERTGLPHHRWNLAISRSWRALMAGDLAGAEAANDESLMLGTGIGAPEAAGVYGAELFVIRDQQDRQDEVADLFIQAATDFPTITSLRTGLTHLYCAMGRLDEAQVMFARDVANDFADYAPDIVWSTAMRYCADNAVDLGHRSAAALLYERLLPHEGVVAFNGGTAEGTLARPLGRLAHLLGRHDQAGGHFERALRTSSRMSDEFCLARARLDYVDLLIDRARAGDAQRARVAVTEALSSAESHGFAGLERRARALLLTLS